jgi:hypothetical protein
MATHYSDLYIFVTPLTTEIVDTYCQDHQFSKEWHFPIFTDAISGKPMFDCAFQNDEYTPGVTSE